MIKKVFNIVPKYAYFPLIAAVLFNMLVYKGNILITKNFNHYDLSIFIDEWIPFCSFFVVFYVLAFVQWVVGYIVISRENKETCYRVMSGEIFAKFICLLFFLFLPTIISRPEVVGNNIFDGITRFIFSYDQPVNLFPSIHCLESYLVFRCSLPLNLPKSYKIGMFLMSVFVFLSTVFIKQHVFVDILGGIFVGEIGLFIAKKVNLFAFIEKKLGKFYEKRK